MRENIIILFIFGLLITGMALEKQYPTKQLSFKIDDKCPHGEIEESKDSVGPINIALINSYSIDNKRKSFTKKILKW